MRNVICIFLLFCSFSVIAQHADSTYKWLFGFGIMPGISSLYISPSDVQVDINKKAIFTTSVGFSANYKMSDKLFFTTGVLLDQRGFKSVIKSNQSSPFNTGVNNSYSIIRLHYISIPLLANFVFMNKNKMRVSVGIGAMVSAPVFSYDKAVFNIQNNNAIKSSSFSTNSDFSRKLSYSPIVNINSIHRVNENLLLSISPQASISYTPNAVFNYFHYWTAGLNFSVLKRF